MLDELLNMDIPEECYTPSGHIVLNFAKITEESVYETARVVDEGWLRVVFSSDLKICVWEFCCSFHEVLINRRSVTPQVHQLREAIQKYQAFAESCSGIATEEFHRNSITVASSIRGIARVLDKPVITDLGYTKRYVRCLQISEIVSSMKDLMDYSKKYGIGPTDAISRIRIHRQSTASRVALIHNARAAEGLREDIEQERAYYDDAISQDSSVISTDHEGTPSLNSSSHATSPTSSTASSKRLVHQADLVKPKRKKQMTNPEENSVPRAPTKPVMDSVQPCNATLVEPNEYSMKVSEDLDTSKNLVAAEADALINAKVLAQNEKKNDDKIESNGKYYYGFETDGAVDKSYYMDQLENLNGASLFPGIHVGSAFTGTLTVNDTHSNNQQFNDELPYWKGELDPIDDIQFE